MKKLIAAVTTAGLLIVGSAGVADAADTPSDQAPATQHAPGKARRVLGGIKVAATTIGIEPKALGAAIKAGQSVAEVATSHDVDPQTVIDAVVAATNKKVDDAVAAGKLDAERAATIKSKAPEKVAKLVNGKVKASTLHRIQKSKLRRSARGGALKVAATTIGIEPKALVDAVKGGQSVADVATSHDVDPQTVIDAVVAAANKKVDDAVAAGKLDAERAATIKSKVTERVTKLVNATPRDRVAASS